MKLYRLVVTANTGSFEVTLQSKDTYAHSRLTDCEQEAREILSQAISAIKTLLEEEARSNPK